MHISKQSNEFVFLFPSMVEHAHDSIDYVPASVHLCSQYNYMTRKTFLFIFLILKARAHCTTSLMLIKCMITCSNVSFEDEHIAVIMA